MAKRLSLVDRVTGVCRVASRAKRHFEVWRVYSSPESRARLWDTLDAYADFVNLDEDAHRTLAILNVTSLFETKDNTLHLRDLIQEVKALGTSPDVVRETEAALVVLEAAVKKVRIIRHNALAHRSASLAYEDVFKLASITADELGELVKSAEAMANSLAKAAGVEPVVMAHYAAGMLDRLFSDAGRLRGKAP
jgi:hypothetical protein